MMELPPFAIHPNEPAGRSEGNIQNVAGATALTPLATDEQVPVLCALAGEVVERVHRGGATEQLGIAPAISSDRVVHARTFPGEPGSFQAHHIGGLNAL